MSLVLLLWPIPRTDMRRFSLREPDRRRPEGGERPVRLSSRSSSRKNALGMPGPIAGFWYRVDGFGGPHGSCVCGMTVSAPPSG